MNPEPTDPDRPEAGSTARSRRSRSILLGAGAIVLLAAVAFAVHRWSAGRYFEETNDAYVAADVVAIAPRVAGNIDQVLVTDHQTVIAGQPLVRIDSRNLVAQVQQLRAQVAAQAANIDVVAHQAVEQQAALDEAAARLQSSQTDLEFVRAEVKRYIPLVDAGAETAQQLQARRRELATAEQQTVALKASVAMAERRLETLRIQRRQTEAQKVAFEEQLNAVQVDLDATTVRAAEGGVIGDLSARPGQFVQAGTRLLSVVPIDRLYVVANFKETQIAHMRAGQSVVVHLDAYPELAAKGHVASVAPGTGAQFSLLPPQNATGNFTKIVQRVPVRIALDVPPGILRQLVAGLSVTAEVDTQGGAR